MRHLLYRRCSRTPRPGIWKQHLDQNHAKLINNINIRLLINMCSPKRFLIMLIRIMFFFTKKSIVQSCPICSVTRYTNQLSSRAWRRRSPLTGAFQFVFNQGQAQLAAWRDPKKGPTYLSYSFTLICCKFMLYQPHPSLKHMASFTVGVQDHHFNPVHHLRSIIKL